MKISRSLRDELRREGRLAGPTPAVYLENLVKGTMKFEMNGQACYNVFYWLFTDTPTILSMGSLGSLLGISWQENIGAYTSEQCALVEVEMRDMSGPDGVVLPVTFTPELTGALSAGDVAPFVAANVRLATAVGGRAARGFKRFAGLVGLQFTLGVWTDDAYDLYQGALNTFFEAISDEDTQLVVASFVQGGLPRITARVTPIIGLILNRNVTTQNSRKKGRGI